MAGRGYLLLDEDHLREKISPRDITHKMVGNMYHIGFL